MTWWKGSSLFDSSDEVVRSSGGGLVVNRMVHRALRREDLGTKYQCQATNTNLSAPVSREVEIILNCKFRQAGQTDRICESLYIALFAPFIASIGAPLLLLLFSARKRPAGQLCRSQITFGRLDAVKKGILLQLLYDRQYTIARSPRLAFLPHHYFRSRMQPEMDARKLA